MIKGIGCDIVEIKRFSAKLQNERISDKIFTEEEKRNLENKAVASAAGIWASKEAVCKALGTGFVNVKYKDIEILHTELGQPYVKLYRQASIKLKELLAKNVHLSISHEEDKALAFAIIE